MTDDAARREKRAEMLRAQGEELDQELSVAEKKAAIREAKRRYGKDWKQILFGTMKSVRLNKETLHTLHSMGGDNPELRRLTLPRRIGR